MKRLALTVILGLAFFAQASAQNIQGTVLDEEENPVEFATVAVLADTLIIGGGITDLDGTFSIALPQGASRVQVSMMGYRMVELAVSAFPTTVHLTPDNVMLEGVVITASLPKTEVKGDALVTNIAGSILEHAGNALDVLGKVPGMITRSGNLEVIGRGTPVYYINGRKVTDNSELRDLTSEDIKSIDVVSNPGAMYGGDVSCVVRIRTVKHQGDGFSFALTSQAKQHIYDCDDFEPSWSVLDLNYRKKGLDIFGKLVYWNNRDYQISDIDGGIYVKDGTAVKSMLQNGMIDYRGHRGGLQYIGGINWQINENHSLGFKLDRDEGTFTNGKMLMETDVFFNGSQTDHVASTNRTEAPDNSQWLGNFYYDGNIGKLNVNFNADFISGHTLLLSEVHETSWNGPAELSSNSDGWSKLGAGKLVLSYPVWNGMLHLGSEETFVRPSQKYSITLAELPSADAVLTENTIAGFAEYAVTLPFGQLSAGLRYEHNNFTYTDNLDAANSLTRVHDDWFPSFSFATMAGPVGISLSYTGKTERPGYEMLTNEIMYDNRFVYQTGDPKLLNVKHRTASLGANWKWLTVSGNYERIDNAFVQWASPFMGQDIMVLRYANCPNPMRKVSAYVIAAPTVGVWYPQYTVGIQKQFLKFDVEDPRIPEGVRTVSHNRPMYLLQANNAFRFSHSWLADADYYIYSPMSHSISEVTKPIQGLSLSVQKSFLEADALTFRLTWSDIFNYSVQYTETDYGSCYIQQSFDGMSPCVQLRVSYRFNSASSKYKGTGAGQDAKSRM